MKKVSVVVLVALFTVGLFSTANAAVNLVQNSSFENWDSNWADPDFTNWSEYGGVGVSTGGSIYSHTGNTAATLAAGPGAGDYASIVSDKININNFGTYEFGVWVNLYSDTNPALLYNGDKAGITTNVYWQGGGASYYYEATEFTSASGWHSSPQGWGYETGWFLISGIFDVPAALLNAELNISLQNWSNTVWRDTSVRVDDAYLQKIPEPSAVLLLGSGLAGLVGYRRWKKMM